MPQTSSQPRTALQMRIVEMALELASQLEASVAEAPTGRSFDACETLLLDRGRQFLRDSLAATLQQQIDQAEKKGDPLAPVLVATPAGTKDPDRVSTSAPWGRSD